MQTTLHRAVWLLAVRSMLLQSSREVAKKMLALALREDRHSEFHEDLETDHRLTRSFCQQRTTLREDRTNCCCHGSRGPACFFAFGYGQSTLPKDRASS
eukprot:6178685-Pleurochrysis_carterae.AAC.2